MVCCSIPARPNSEIIYSAGEPRREAPKSALARMLSCLSAGSVLIALRSYFDGSKRGRKWTDCDVIALAGFAAGDEIMNEFERDYAVVLADDRFRPSAPYLHMKELRSQSKDSPFSPAKGWNDERRTRLAHDVLELLGSLDKARSRLFVCSVEPRAIDRLRATDPTVPSPIRICTHYCPHYVTAWYARDYPGIISDSHYFFDWDEPFEPDFKRLRRLQMSNRFEISGNKENWKLIKTITSMDPKSPEGAVLQIADLLAWGTVRQRSDHRGEFLIGIAVAVKKIISASWVHINDSNAAKWCANVPR